MIAASKRERVLILGAAGQLGCEMRQRWPERGYDCVLIRAREAIDLCKPGLLGHLKTLHPTAIINCAGYTDVLGAEDEPEQAYEANAYGVDRLACCCRQLQIPLIHLSSSYVFGGRRRMEERDVAAMTPTERDELAYAEHDAPCPANVYGASKLAGEHAILNHAARDHTFQYWIIRTAGLFERPWRHSVRSYPQKYLSSILGKIANFEAIGDVFWSWTYIKDLADMIQWIVENRDGWDGSTGCWAPSGIYHVVNQGIASPYELVSEISHYLGRSPRVIFAPKSDMGLTPRLLIGILPKLLSLKASHPRHPSMPVGRHWKRAIADFCEEARKSPVFRDLDWQDDPVVPVGT